MKRCYLLPTLLFAFILIVLQRDCLGICISASIKIDTLNNGEFVVNVLDPHDSSIVSKDTISSNRFLKDLITHYNSTLKCYVGQIDTVIHFIQWQDPWWVYMDSIKVEIDTVIKGNILPTYWSIDGPDPWRMCFRPEMDSCIGIADDNYKSYSKIKGIKYLFFSKFDSLRGSSVNPNWCIGDKGNRVDESNFVWSDYPDGYPQVKILLRDLLSAIDASIVHSFPINPSVLKNRNLSEFYDIRGRRIYDPRRTNMASCILILKHSNSIKRINSYQLHH